MKKLFFILFLIPFFGYTQVDLAREWQIFNNKNETDSTRLYALWTIAYDGYLYNNPDSSIYFAQKMYDFAEKKGQTQFMGFALGTQGSANYYLGKLDLAIECHKAALEIHKKLRNKGSQGSVYNNIANIYRDRGQQAEALTYFMKGLKIYEGLDNKSAIGTVMGNIGAVYADMRDAENSKIWYDRAIKLKRESGDSLGISIMLGGIGMRYMNEGMLDSAMTYFKESLKIRILIQNKNGIAHSTQHVGQVHYALGNLDSALYYYNKALVLMEELNAESGIANLNFDLAELYKRKGNTKLAIKYAKKSLETAKKSGFIDSERDGSYMLFEIYRNQGNTKEALEMHINYILMRDSMFKEANQKAILEQEYQYNYDKKFLADSLNREKEKHLESIQHEQEREKQQIIIATTAGGLALVVVFLLFVFNRLRITKKQKQVIEEQKDVVEEAHAELEEKNKEILDSINYAKRIQSAILPPDKVVKEYLQESFILYKPKDIVAGDFYWLEQREGKVLFAAADCTGHGVPGAMVSVICNNALNRSVREHGLTDPGKILDKTREIVIAEFQKSDEEVKDGMDIAICSLDDKQLKYAGANNPLWLIRNGELIETKPNKQPIGEFDQPQPYTTHTVELEKGDAFYIFSDGYVDQFGGEKGKKFKTRAFRELLLSIHDKSMEEQRKLIDQNFETWKGSLEQIDDVCIIGVRI